MDANTGISIGLAGMLTGGLAAASSPLAPHGERHVAAGSGASRTPSSWSSRPTRRPARSAGRHQRRRVPRPGRPPPAHQGAASASTHLRTRSATGSVSATSPARQASATSSWTAAGSSSWCSSAHSWQRSNCDHVEHIERRVHNHVTTSVRISATADLGASNRTAIRDSLDAAFAGDFTDDDWAHALGGTHAIVEVDVLVADVAAGAAPPRARARRRRSSVCSGFTALGSAPR